MLLQWLNTSQEKTRKINDQNKVSSSQSNSVLGLIWKITLLTSMIRSVPRLPKILQNIWGWVITWKIISVVNTKNFYSYHQCMNHSTHSCREITETIQKMLNNGEITYKSTKPNPPKVAVMTHYNLLVSPKSNQIMFRVMILPTPQALPQSPPPLVSKMSPLP